MPALDGLRGVAILMVVFTHVASGWFAARSIFPATDADLPNFNIPDWVSRIGAFAQHGVTLFFVVSAFTLTLRCAGRERGGAGFWLDYAIRRVARVGPAYWIAGIAYALLAGFTARFWAPDGIGVADIAVAALFGTSWQGGAAMAVVPGGWSVSCEVSFYVALPFALRLIENRLWRAILLTAAATLLVQIAADIANGRGGWDFTRHYINPLAQAPVFLFGITAALVARQMELPPLRWLACLLLAFAVFALPFSQISSWGVLPHLPFAATAALVVLLAARHPPALLSGHAIRRLGEVSYSIYLIHFGLLAPSLTIAAAVFPAYGWPTLALHMALTTTATFILANLSYRWIEQPGICWAARLPKLFQGRRGPALVKPSP